MNISDIVNIVIDQCSALQERGIPPAFVVMAPSDFVRIYEQEELLFAVAHDDIRSGCQLNGCQVVVDPELEGRDPVVVPAASALAMHAWEPLLALSRRGKA